MKSTLHKTTPKKQMQLGQLSGRFENYLNAKVNPVYRIHYALWIFWWPLWRGLFTGRKICQYWDKHGLVKQGQTFLDFGCGTGDFSIPAAKIVDREGTVYALDCFPRQLKAVQKRAAKEGLSNVVTMLSDVRINLPDETIDVVWMCDVLHELTQKRATLQELYRVLRRGGALAVYDDMEDEVLAYTDGLFQESNRDGKLLMFVK
jgi:SAM-dependent methyltransferase